MEREKLLSISGPEVGVEEIEAKLIVEVEEGKKEFQALVSGLATKSMQLKEASMDLRRHIQLTEQKLVELEKLIRETVERSS